MPNTKHGDYIVELGPNRSIFKQIIHDQVVVMGSRDLGNVPFSMGWSLITKPFLMVDNEHTHDFDQILFFLGDQENVSDFGGIVNLRVGNDHQEYVIDYTSCVYIPAGVLHCPLDVVSVEKPFMFIDITLSPGVSAHPVPEKSK